MRRLDLRIRRALLLAATILITAGAFGPATAGTANLADDRPPLVAVEPAPAGVAPASHLVDFSVVPGGDESVEIVLKGDGGLGYQAFKLSAPDRLVLDLPGVKANLDRSRAEVGKDGVVRVRVGQYRLNPQPVARVVLELERPLEFSVLRDGSNLRVQFGARSAAKAAPVAAPAIAAASKPVAVAETKPAAVQAPKPAPVEDAKPAPVAETKVAEAVPAPAPRPAPAAASAATAPAERHAPAPVEVKTAPKPQPASVVSSSDVASNATAATKSASASKPAPAPVAAPVSDTPDRSAFAAKAARPLAPEGTAFAPAPVQAAAEPAPAPAPQAAPAAGGPVALPTIETKTIQDQRRTYSGRPISLNLIDADIRQVFGVFHELSGLNFVLDPGVVGTVTIVVDEVPWDQALDLILQNNDLEMVLEGNVIRIAKITKLAREAQDRRTLKESKELEATPVTITRTLSYAQAKEIERVVREALMSPKGRVIVDPRTNTLIIRDIPDRIEAIDKLLTTLDAETPQVMIEARIVEVSRDFSRDLGVKWGTHIAADPANGTATNLQFPHRASVDYALNLPKNPGSNALTLSFGNVLDTFTLDITLDALEEQGYAKRLASPKVATQNNATAEIEQGVRFPVTTTTATEIHTEFVAASLRLRCTPQITAEGTVILDVEVANDQPDFVNRNEKTVPAVNTQRAMTKVLIADGGTTVIGGIYTVNEGTSTTGVPWFSKLPGFGWLFRSKNVTNKSRELLIFITPRIVKAS